MTRGGINGIAGITGVTEGGFPKPLSPYPNPPLFNVALKRLNAKSYSIAKPTSSR